LGVVTTIQNQQDKRLGFLWLQFVERIAKPSDISQRAQSNDSLNLR
jgi:hypothetical protein